MLHSKEVKNMSVQEITECMRQLAEKYDYVVVEDIHTANPCIYGTDAGKSALESGGGKAWIVWKEDIMRNAVPDADGYISASRLAEQIYEYFN